MATDKEILYGDPGYTGEVVDETSVARFADVDYYRDKIRELQTWLNTLAATADNLMELRDQVTDPDLLSWIEAWLSDFDSRKSSLTMAVESVNAAANTANALGVRMPVVSTPMNFAALPAYAIAALAAAVAGTAWAISYSVSKVTEARNRVTMRETLALLPEPERAAALAAGQKIELAQSQAQGALGNIAGIVKWIALGVAIFFAYKAVRETGLLGR